MRRRALVSGGAGFLGSLGEALLSAGYDVIAVDDCSTGRLSNLEHLLADHRFVFLHRDICAGVEVSGPLDAVLHFASAASPPDSPRLPIETLRVGSIGTLTMPELAREKGARCLPAMAQSALDWSPTVDITDGLERTIKWLEHEADQAVPA